MKHTAFLSWVPVLVALGACSGGSGSNAQAEHAKGDGGTGDSAASGGDSSGDDGSAASAAIEYDATLTGAEVVPSVLTSSNGAAKFFLQPDGSTLTYDITLSVPGATAVDVHLAHPGEVGAVTHPLTPLSSHMTGSVTLSADEQNDITSDMLYIDVETAANPGGEVRGQLMLAGAQLFVTTAIPAEELPPVTSGSHAHASFILSPDQGTLLYHVVTDAPATDVRLQRAIGGLVGPVTDDLSPIAPTMDGNFQIAAADPPDLIAGHLYLNIVTAQNQAGELRGQIIKPGESLLAGVLSGTTESPPTSSTASGGAQFILSADQSSVRYEVVVSGTIPTAAELDGAAPGKSGPMLVPLTLAPEGALGMMSVSSGDAARLLQGDAYVNIKTASYVGGELRANLALE